MARIDHDKIDAAARKKWAELEPYKTVEDQAKEKLFVLDMFPYPSGEGLHVGHPKGYIATDIYSRYSRMRGKSVLHPMGWDAFGLPAENYALKHKVHPREAVERNIARFKEQLSLIGIDYDWDREINTTDPSYYRWTQWIFLKLFEQGLAYQSNEPINWCPSCMTGLANEDLDGDACERCGTKVEQKRLPQWVLKITEYADRILADLSGLAWPEHIKEAQRNWIGRSEGAKLSFAIADSAESIEVFTTRADTLYGVTYLVVAPEHPLAVKSAETQPAVRAYSDAAKAKTERERGESREKTGVLIEGVRAVNPLSQEQVPVYVADYVLGGYGTGAVMAVPAHDERDFAFAKQHGLPVRQVVAPRRVDHTNPWQEGKKLIERNATISIVYDPRTDAYLTLSWTKQNWKTFITGGVDDGEDVVASAIREIREETGYSDVELTRIIGKSQSEFYAAHKDVNRLARNTVLLFELKSDARDQIDGAEAAQHQPVWMRAEDIQKAGFQHAEFSYIWERLREDKPYTESGVLLDSGPFSGRDSAEARKEMALAAGGTSSVTYKIKDWVFSRQRYWGEPIPIIHCPKDGAVAVPYEDLPVMLPEVASYEPTGTGESPLAGIEDWVNVACPKCKGPAKRETNTMPQWAGSSWYYLRFMDPRNDHELVSAKKEKYWAPVDVYVGGDHAVRHLIYARFWHKFLHDIGVVTTAEPFARLEFLGFILAEDGRKMSKRYGNVINPDDVVREYGADAFRVYEMFMGPFENTTAWNTASIAGVARFLERVVKAAGLVRAGHEQAIAAELARTVHKVGKDIEAFKFNTAVSQMMIFLNALEKAGAIGAAQWSDFVRVLAPFAPHVTEFLWEALGNEGSVHQAPWPVFDESALKDALVPVIIQVKGKKKAEMQLSPDASEEEALDAARAVLPDLPLDGAKVVYVPGRILNVVPGGG